MADIDRELQAIKDAIYGEEVRGSIHDAIKAVNTEVVGEIDTVKHKLVMVSEEEPTDPDNVIYVDPTTEEVVIPTYDDFEEVKDEIQVEVQKIEQFDGRISQLSESITENLYLLSDYIYGTVQTVSVNEDGLKESIIHTKNGEVLRTDTFAYYPNSKNPISSIETRTLADGTYITIEDNINDYSCIISDIHKVVPPVDTGLIDNGENYSNWYLSGNGTYADANGIHLVQDGSVEAANIDIVGAIDGKSYRFEYEVFDTNINSSFVCSAGNFISASGGNVILDKSIGTHETILVHDANATHSRIRLVLSSANTNGTYINIGNFKLFEVEV